MGAIFRVIFVVEIDFNFATKWREHRRMLAFGRARKSEGENGYYGLV